MEQRKTAADQRRDFAATFTIQRWIDGQFDGMRSAAPQYFRKETQ